MIGTIIGTTSEHGAGGAIRTYDYLIVQTDEWPYRLKIERSEFPRDCRSDGDKVELDFIQVGNGYRHMPRKIMELKPRDCNEARKTFEIE